METLKHDEENSIKKIIFLSFLISFFVYFFIFKAFCMHKNFEQVQEMLFNEKLRNFWAVTRIFWWQKKFHIVFIRST